MPTRWLAIRFSSTMSTRKCRAFSGSSRPQQLLHGHRPAEVHVHAGQVVHPVGVGDPLARRHVLADLLGASVQIADVRLGHRHDLAVGAQHQTQDPVRAGVLRPHVDEHLVGANVKLDDPRVIQCGHA